MRSFGHTGWPSKVGSNACCVEECVIREQHPPPSQGTTKTDHKEPLRRGGVLLKRGHTTVPQQAADAGLWVAGLAAACFTASCSPAQGFPCPWLRCPSPRWAQLPAQPWCAWLAGVCWV
ncbi:hypothetical protein HaLaN_04524 [Haematococcus lacustris]|uniref:Uncharacterized protein n=1 Tax=Haematococcus lacustris TaxID=44745 RepID=A0A699YNP2_HAELA|nr:hypothetical protein HaLaN_04524 [Haematococcus lacustris]